MIFTRFISLVRLASVAVGIVFTFQLMMTEADHFGLHLFDLTYSLSPSGDDRVKDIPVEHTHSASPHSPYLQENSKQELLLLSSSQISFRLQDEFAPDGPVLAIDHPPQLS